MAENNNNSALNPVEDTLPPWETELENNPNSALNPAWDITPKDKSENAEFAVIPPSKYADAAPAAGSALAPKEKKAKKEKKEKAPKQPGEKKSSTKIIIIAVALILVAAIAAAVVFVGLPLMKYNKANKLFAQGNYEGAISTFKELGDYKDAPQKIEQVKAKQTEEKYNEAVALYDDSKFEEAQKVFEELGDYEDSADYVKSCSYQLGLKAMNEKDYKTALSYFEKCDYDEAVENSKECMYQICLADKKGTDETREMLGKLIEAKYKTKEVKKLGKKLFPFTAENIVINNDEEDIKKQPSKVTAKDDNIIYVHFLVKGGLPGDEVTIVVKYSWGDGKEKEYKFSGARKDGDQAYFYTSFKDNNYPKGKFSVELYTADGDLMGKGSVTVE